MKKNINITYIAGFLFSIHLALTAYINSSFLEIYIDKNYVGIIYTIASIVTIIGLLQMPKILTFLGNRKAILLFSFINFISLFILAIANKSILIIPAFILYFAVGNFIFANFDIFIEKFSEEKSIGKLRGLYLTIINMAWVIAQLISGSIIAKSSFKGIYLFSSLFMFLVVIIFSIFLKDFKDPKYVKVPRLETLKFFIKKKDILKIYIINFILKFFFAWMVIYTPIYLHEYLHFDWSAIGIIFSIMLLPFVLLEFPLGKLSDKMGEKKILLCGFFISTLFTLIIPFIKEPKIIIWAIILFGTRIGAATIEAMSEIYFFKKVEKENSGAISFFRNTSALSFIIAPILAIPILFLIPSFEYLFFILGAIMLIGFFVTLRLRDIK